MNHHRDYIDEAMYGVSGISEQEVREAIDDGMVCSGTLTRVHTLESLGGDHVVYQFMPKTELPIVLYATMLLELRQACRLARDEGKKVVVCVPSAEFGGPTPVVDIPWVLDLYSEVEWREYEA